MQKWAIPQRGGAVACAWGLEGAVPPKHRGGSPPAGINLILIVYYQNFKRQKKGCFFMKQTKLVFLYGKERNEKNCT